MKADDMLWRLVTGTAKRRKRTILTMLWLTMFLKSVYSDLINNKITISLLVIILSPNIYNKYKYTSIHFANVCKFSKSVRLSFVCTHICKVVCEVQINYTNIDNIWVCT